MVDLGIENAERMKLQNGLGWDEGISSAGNEKDWAPKEGGPGKEIVMREAGLLVRGQEILGRRKESNT